MKKELKQLELELKETERIVKAIAIAAEKAKETEAISAEIGGAGGPCGSGWSSNQSA